MKQSNDLPERFVPPKPRYLLQRLFLELFEDGDGVIKRLGLVSEVIDDVEFELWIRRSLLQDIWGKRLRFGDEGEEDVERTEDLSVAWIGVDAVDDGERELSLGEVLCEAFVFGVLPEKYEKEFGSTR